MSILQPEIIGSFLSVFGVVIALWFYLERHEKKAKERREEETNKYSEFNYTEFDQLNDKTFGDI